MKQLLAYGLLLAASAANGADPMPLPPTSPVASLIGPVLNVVNPEKQIAFYRDGLGMSLAMTLKGKVATEYMLSFGGDPRQPGIILQHDVAGATSPKHGTYFNRLVVRAVNLDDIAKRLDAAGYNHTPIRDVAKGYRMMMATDPEGYKLEIVQSANRA